MLSDIPEIDSSELAKRMNAKNPPCLLDVREPWELELAKLSYPNLVNLPMSVLAVDQFEAFPAEFGDKNVEIIVFCHHGVRSASVTQWMMRGGWRNILSLRGGIDAFAAEVDPSIGFY
jgi:rhodanese-related sulfurtransferase